jgi:hypothetical protein
MVRRNRRVASFVNLQKLVILMQRNSISWIQYHDRKASIQACAIISTISPGFRENDPFRFAQLCEQMMPRSTGIGIVPETTHRRSSLIPSAKLVGCGTATQRPDKYGCVGRLRHSAVDGTLEVLRLQWSCLLYRTALSCRAVRPNVG